MRDRDVLFLFLWRTLTNTFFLYQWAQDGNKLCKEGPGQSRKAVTNEEDYGQELQFTVSIDHFSKNKKSLQKVFGGLSPCPCAQTLSLSLKKEKKKGYVIAQSVKICTYFECIVSPQRNPQLRTGHGDYLFTLVHTIGGHKSCRPNSNQTLRANA